MTGTRLQTVPHDAPVVGMMMRMSACHDMCCR
jgi:hypothetical protein